MGSLQGSEKAAERTSTPPAASLPIKLNYYSNHHRPGADKGEAVKPRQCELEGDP